MLRGVARLILRVFVFNDGGGPAVRPILGSFSLETEGLQEPVEHRSCPRLHQRWRNQGYREACLVPAAVPSNYGDDIFEVPAPDGAMNNLLKPGSAADARRGSNRCRPNVGWVIEIQVDKN